jgi:hypothetical protein
MYNLQLIIRDVIERFEQIAYALGCHSDLDSVELLTANRIALLIATEIAERLLGQGRHHI